MQQGTGEFPMHMVCAATECATGPVLVDCCVFVSAHLAFTGDVLVSCHGYVKPHTVWSRFSITDLSMMTTLSIILCLTAVLVDYGITGVGESNIFS